MSNQEDISPGRAWQIREFPEALRRRITKAAAKQGISVADWLIGYFSRHGIEEEEDRIQQPRAPLSTRELAEIAGMATLPRWVRSAAAQRLGDVLGARKPPPPRKLVATVTEDNAA